MIEPAKENQVVKIVFKTTAWLTVDIPAVAFNKRTQGEYNAQISEDGEMGEEDLLKDMANEFVQRSGELQMLAGNDDSWAEFSFETDEVEIEDGPEYIDC